VAWDGTDIWTPQPDVGEGAADYVSAGTSKGKGRRRTVALRIRADEIEAPATAGLTRTEGMLRRIRTDPSLYTNALSADEEVRHHARR
jgi:hypothetical protein